MKTDIKLRVTPEQSEAVQEICFANGIYWHVKENEISYTEAEYLFIEPTKIWFRRIANHESGMETVGYTEVDADLFIRTNGTCEESREDIFKQYGFEVPDFDCTILTKIKKDYIGYVVNQNVVLALSWYKDGFAYAGEKSYTQYNLTPIKKPWYETCKFPVLVWDEDNDLLALRTRGEYTSSYLELCKPLTNKEINQLKPDF